MIDAGEREREQGERARRERCTERDKHPALL